MQDPGGVMVWLAENIQACLRIFRRTQHQWLVRDILHQPQGVYSVFVPWPAFTGLIRPIRGRIRRTCPLAHWRNRGEVNVLTHAVPWSFTMRQSAPPRIDTLLAFYILLLTIWIFQVLLESLKIHRGLPRSNLSDAENTPKWPCFVKIIEKFFPGRPTRGAMVGRPDTLWSVVQAPYGRSTTDLMVGRPSGRWMKWTKNWVVGQWFFAQKGQNVQFWFSRLQVEVAKIQLSFW